MTNTVRKLIETALNTEYGGVLPLVFDDTRDDFNEAVRVSSLSQLVYDRGTIGSVSSERYKGQCICDIFTGREAGTGKALSSVDALTSTLRLRRFQEGGITVEFYAVDVRKIPSDTHVFIKATFNYFVYKTSLRT